MPSPWNVFSSLNSGAKRGRRSPWNQIKCFESHPKTHPSPNETKMEILLERFIWMWTRGDAVLFSVPCRNKSSSVITRSKDWAVASTKGCVQTAGGNDLICFLLFLSGLAYSDVRDSQNWRPPDSQWPACLELFTQRHIWRWFQSIFTRIGSDYKLHPVSILMV